MNRMENAFARLRSRGEKGLVPFITAGDPHLDATYDVMLALADLGASAIELGVPFSDPIADGPVIQRASQRALARGTGLSQVLDLVAQFTQRSDVPVVLFSYFNPLLQYGLPRLLEDAKRAAVAGLLVTDLPVEESTELAAGLCERDMSLILLASPTTRQARLERILALATGFLYVVSRTGVTGAHGRFDESLSEVVAQVRGRSDIPIAVGFGISTADRLRAAHAIADAAVVGSALVEVIEQHPEAPAAAAQEFVKNLLAPATGSAANRRKNF